MLLIRTGQLSALAQSRLASFEVKMMEHLRRAYPDWELSDASTPSKPEALREFVRHGIARAERYGFRLELDIARYLHVMHDLGPHFDESQDCPWAQSLLKQDISESEKMNRLRDARDYQLEANRIGHAR